MKKNVCLFMMLLLGVACGSSDDLSIDQGNLLSDVPLTDESSAPTDEGVLADGTRAATDASRMEDGTIVFRDGQRPRPRSDVEIHEDEGLNASDTAATDTSVPASDLSSQDISIVTDNSTVVPSLDVPSSMDLMLNDPGAPSEDSGAPVFDKGAIIPADDSGLQPEDSTSPITDITTLPSDEGTIPSLDVGAVVEDTLSPTPDTGPPEPGPCSSSADCPNGVCVGGLCFYDTGGTFNCEEVVLCMAACPEGAVGCDVDCLNDGDGLAQALYADLWLCWVTAEDFLEIAESCAGKASDCYYESEGSMNCAQAYECTFDCEGQFACVDDCLEQATSLAQTLYTGLAYCLQGACAGNDDPDCKINNMMSGGLCHIFSDLCGNVPQPQ